MELKIKGSKIALIAVALFLVITAVTLLTSQSEPPLEPQSLRLPTGSEVRISRVSFGTTHSRGPGAPWLVNHLPGFLRRLVEKAFGSSATTAAYTTSEPRLVLWLDVTNVPPPGAGSSLNCHVLLADGSNVVAGPDQYFSDWGSSGPPMDFAVFPRRSPIMSLCFFVYDAKGEYQLIGKLPFRNPIKETYAAWTPEPVPATRRVGDVEITVNSMITGYGSHQESVQEKGKWVSRRTTKVTDGRVYTTCDVDARSLIDTNQVWKVTDLEISDVTGNKTTQNSLSWEGGTAGVSFAPSLWPDEKVWGLKLILKREKGFKPSEEFVFAGVPLGDIDKTNTLSLSTNFNGVDVTLEYIFRRAPNTNSSWSSSQVTQIRFTNSKMPAGTYLDLKRVVLDTGKELSTESWSRSDMQRTYDYKVIPLEAKTADFHMVVQQAISAEFKLEPVDARGTNAP